MPLELVLWDFVFLLNFLLPARSKSWSERQSLVVSLVGVSVSRRRSDSCVCGDGMCMVGWSELVSVTVIWWESDVWGSVYTHVCELWVELVFVLLNKSMFVSTFTMESLVVLWLGGVNAWIWELMEVLLVFSEPWDLVEPGEVMSWSWKLVLD